MKKNQIFYSLNKIMTRIFIIFVLLICCTKTQGSGGGGGEEPSLKINLNPPEENPKETVGTLKNKIFLIIIAALKDIDKLESDLRVGLNDVNKFSN